MSCTSRKDIETSAMPTDASTAVVESAAARTVSSRCSSSTAAQCQCWGTNGCIAWRASACANVVLIIASTMSWADDELNTLRGLDSDEDVSAFVLRALRVLPTVKVLDQPPLPALAPALALVFAVESGLAFALDSETKSRPLLWEAKPRL